MKFYTVQFVVYRIDSRSPLIYNIISHKWRIFPKGVCLMSALVFEVALR